MKKILLLFILILSFLMAQPTTSAAAEQNRVLLVYDSMNLANKGEEKVDALQRLVSSMNVQLDTVADKDYLENTLRDDVYAGVITFVNWSEKGISSTAFIKDRKHFSGRKLHIGMDITADERADFSGQFRELSHRQYTLVHQKERYRQQLDYLDQSVVLETEEGTPFGTLLTQEQEEKHYPFGVIQEKYGFLPLFSTKGAVFLQSAELIQQWLTGEQKSQTFKPMPTLKSFTPLNDMTVANDFIDTLNQKAIYYALSGTSTSRNNDLATFDIFTDLLAKAQHSSLLFYSVPAVNRADLQDNRQLKMIVEDQISLLVSKNLYPVGISAPGYWNQDAQYRADALSYGKTIILEKNPAVDAIHYRVQDNRGAVYHTVFYSLDIKDLAGIQWQLTEKYTDYEFPMPVSLAVDFPADKKEAAVVLEQLKESIFDLSQPYDRQYVFQIQTETQNIQYKNGQIFINDQVMSQFSALEQTELPQQEFHGLFYSFFKRINFGLVWFIIAVIVILIFLFFRGRQNYRSKYINRGREKK